MNYEELYSQIQGYEKTVKDLLASQQKVFKRMSKSMEKGDLKSALKDMSLIDSGIADSARAMADYRNAIESFDAKEYMESGDFAGQMLEYFQKASVDAKGEYPVYEVFPYKVKIDVENLDVYVDKKRVQCLRPASLVGDIKASRDKLMNASFNPLLFANELAAAYDTAVFMQAKGKPAPTDPDLYLTGLYKYLTPMRRFRKDYDIQSFAFDLARLYSSDIEGIDDGRKFQFGPSRNINKSIRVLDKDGHEQFLATIRYYNT